MSSLLSTTLIVSFLVLLVVAYLWMFYRLLKGVIVGYRDSKSHVERLRKVSKSLFGIFFLIGVVWAIYSLVSFIFGVDIRCAMDRKLRSSITLTGPKEEKVLVFEYQPGVIVKIGYEEFVNRLEYSKRSDVQEFRNCLMGLGENSDEIYLTQCADENFLQNESYFQKDAPSGFWGTQLRRGDVEIIRDGQNVNYLSEEEIHPGCIAGGHSYDINYDFPDGQKFATWKGLVVW